MGVCLLTRDPLRRHSHAGLAGLRPPRISDGAATLNMAVGLDTAERSQKRDTRIHLAPQLMIWR